MSTCARKGVFRHEHENDEPASGSIPLFEQFRFHFLAHEPINLRVTDCRSSGRAQRILIAFRAKFIRTFEQLNLISEPN